MNCAVPGCPNTATRTTTTNPHCDTHRYRLRKFGDVQADKPIGSMYARNPHNRITNPATSFWAKVDKTATCWLYTGATWQGYGSLNRATYGTASAHRYAWQETNGPIPDDMVIDHVCRVRNCVRPDHLRVVTRAVNNTENSLGVAALAARRRANATNCVNGHEWTPENTYTTREDRRLCRACQREQQARYLARKAAGLVHREPVS